MDKRIFDLFSEKSGVLPLIEKCVSEYSMKERLLRGTLVGLSGGADSVMLLLYLTYLRAKKDFPLLAVHVNHGIRGEEADRDERFSRDFSKALGVEFVSVRVDVPSLARERGIGLEEAARNARYSIFSDIISGRNDISTIAVAHNADDNFETVLMNMLRGAGTRGLSGTPPVRDNIVRPLIYLRKPEIASALLENGFEFVTDSTNESDDYTRNYIRHNIVPSFDLLTDSLSSSVARLSKNLREDDDCLFGLATAFCEKYSNGCIPQDALKELHPSLFFRALSIYASDALGASIERVHAEAIRECLMRGGDFSISVSGATFVMSSGFGGFYTDVPCFDREFEFGLQMGENGIPEYGAVVEITDNKNKFSTNVYNKSTQADLTSAIIVGDLFVRNKKDGDAYFFGGMTHKLKKMFNDRKIPLKDRARIPVLCDAKGVVWVPGFGVRDDGGKGALYIRISETDVTDQTFLLPERKGRNNKERQKVT